MLSSRSMIQTSRTLNPNDETNSKIFSTYQDEYNSAKTHGNPVNHLGNTAYLHRPHTHAVSMNEIRAKPFLSPSYHNLNSESYIANRFSDNYSNNYRTSEDNVLRRSMPNRPIKTKLDHLYKVEIAPVSKVDSSSAYEQEYLHGRVNDHFVSKKLLKTDTNNLKDTLVKAIMFIVQGLTPYYLFIHAKKVSSSGVSFCFAKLSKLNNLYYKNTRHVLLN